LLSAEVGRGVMAQTQQKQVEFEAEKELLTGLIQAAQIHNNQLSLESIHLQIVHVLCNSKLSYLNTKLCYIHVHISIK
jgi:hypothetical protein